MPVLFAIKARVEALLATIPLIPRHAADHVMQFVADRWSEVLPRRLLAFRDRYAHHLMLRMADAGIEEARELLTETLSAEASGGLDPTSGWFPCTSEESEKAFLHRFAAAGAAICFAVLNGGGEENLVALDVALPRNASNWREVLPERLAAQSVAALYYGHFFCRVFYQDYVLRPGVDVHAFKTAMLELQDTRGVEYPAERNVGHLYEAKPALREFYRALDPTNAMNAGVGKMSKRTHYACNCAQESGFRAE